MRSKVIILGVLILAAVAIVVKVYITPSESVAEKKKSNFFDNQAKDLKVDDGKKF